MRTLLYFVAVLVVSSCTKKEALIITENEQGVETSSRNNTPDIVYVYNDIEYPLYYEDKENKIIRQDETTKALDDLVNEKGGFVTFHFPDKPKNYHYWFDTEFDGYDYIEKNSDALIGRKFKYAHRIEQLKDRLVDQYGNEIDYNNPTIREEAIKAIEDIYTELKVNLDLPRDIAAFLGVEGGQLSPRRNSVLTVYEADGLNGYSMDVETAPNTVIWTYGNWGCFTMAANPNLTQEFQPNGNNWNDAISSACLNYIDGADAMAVGYYKDIDYAVYACGYTVNPYYANGQSSYCDDMINDRYAGGPSFACGHLDNQISSIRIKAFWQGCFVNDGTQFDDLLNL